MNSRNGMSDEQITQISSKLLFIGRIEPGQKVDVTTLKIYDNTYATSLSRTLTTGRNRDATLSLFTNTLHEAYEAIRYFTASQKLSSIEQDTYQLLLDGLSSSRKGIQATITTYEADVFFVSRLETLLRTLESHLKFFTQSSNAYSESASHSRKK